MTWVRYDDNVANHPKIAPLDDATYRLWREAIEWCAHNLTDGVILSHQLALTSTRASRPRASILVRRGLWHPAGITCTSEQCPPTGEDGWFIHDFWDYQRSREKVRAEQAASRDRQRKWMEKARANRRTSTVTNASPNGVTNGVIDTVTGGVTNAVANGNPAPPRPAPKGRAGTTSPQSTPAAASAGGAAGVERLDQHGPRCRTCGNLEASAYHRNVCIHSDAIAAGGP